MASKHNKKDGTRKPRVIERIFKERLDPNTLQLNNPVVTNDELVAAIKRCNQGQKKKLSTNNPANFLKDYLRSPLRNELWPEHLKKARVTARQKYREKRVFAFAPYEDGQIEPFPDHFILDGNLRPHIVESVSLPSAARGLGRQDEAWLIQVCVHQRLVQTHFALHSPISTDCVDLFHLQNSVKTTPEVDALFLMTLRRGEIETKALVTLEAKRDEPILVDQIRAQVALMAKHCSEKTALKDIALIIPLAARSQHLNNTRVVGVFEMAPISVQDGAAAHAADREHLLELEITSEMAYRFRPDISGI